MEISFLAGELLFTGIWLAVRAAVWIRQGRVDFRREAQLLLLYLNLFVIIRMVFFPFHRVGGKVQPLLFRADAVFPLRVNLVPLVHIFRFATKKDLLLNILGNVGLFIPSGIILPVLYHKLDRCWKVVAVGALISLSIELLQLPFSARATDVDDLILNTLGCLMGYGIYAAARAVIRRRKKRPARARRKR